LAANYNLSMKKILFLVIVAASLAACNKTVKEQTVKDVFDFEAFAKTMYDDSSNRFADLRILPYDATDIKNLTVKQKELVYYLSQAALSGREIVYAQNYKHNIQIKRTLEEIYQKYTGDKTTADWKAFEVYLKRVFIITMLKRSFYQPLAKPILRN
jgi:dipeptidyl-peptidase-3